MNYMIRCRTLWSAFGFAVWLGTACGHTEKVQDRPSAGEQEEDKNKDKNEDKKNPDQNKRSRRETSAAVAREDVPSETDSRSNTDEVPVVQTPDRLLSDASVKKFQSRLQEKGFLTKQDNRLTGKVDGPTEQALLKFQREQNLPATGVPDRATARALGLDAGELFDRAEGQQK